MYTTASGANTFEEVYLLCFAQNRIQLSQIEYLPGLGIVVALVVMNSSDIVEVDEPRRLSRSES